MRIYGNLLNANVLMKLISLLLWEFCHEDRFPEPFFSSCLKQRRSIYSFISLVITLYHLSHKCHKLQIKIAWILLNHLYCKLGILDMKEAVKYETSMPLIKY